MAERVGRVVGGGPRRRIGFGTAGGTSSAAMTITPRRFGPSMPDPALTGNAGSFFKNPIVSESQAAHVAAVAGFSPPRFPA